MAVKSFGIEAPVIREGDNLAKIVTDSVLKATKIGTIIEDSRALGKEVNVYDIHDKDIIGITESVVARAAGLYATVDDIAEDIIKKFGKNAIIILSNMIYSRNRFSMILKGIARGAKKLYLDMPDFDEVGNPSGVNPFTGVDIKKYYRQIIESENCECSFAFGDDANGYIYCGLHDSAKYEGMTRACTLADICSDKNPDYGVLGSNKATDEKIKLFPTIDIATRLCEQVKKEIKNSTGKDVFVCVYGDGCFKDPVGGIWEFADPITMPGYTNPEVFESTPNEIKLKAFADDKFSGLSGKELENAIKNEIKNKDNNLVGNMASQGTTPRKIRDLVASLMDLTSGSGDKGTPIIVVQHYFENYAS